MVCMSQGEYSICACPVERGANRPGDIPAEVDVASHDSHRAHAAGGVLTTNSDADYHTDADDDQRCGYPEPVRALLSRSVTFPIVRGVGHDLRGRASGETGTSSPLPR